jgi:lysophospholipid acyltransferase (LPLAT)-like uncharacterized protein
MTKTPKRTKKKRKRRLPGRAALMKLGGLLAAKGIQTWMNTLDVRAAFYDHSVDPLVGMGGPRIYVFWHEYILLPLALRGHCHLAMLLSQHPDADVLERVAFHAGFDCVRGSTFRGGARAIWDLQQRSERQHLTITPDGPRGPRRRLAQGPVYLASRLQLPLVVMGLGCDRPLRVNSWDRFVVPRPFSRARAVIGPPTMLPPDLNRDGIEAARVRVESLLNSLTSEAEAWATAGTRKLGEVPIHSGFAPRPQRATPQQSPSVLLQPSRAA